MHVLLSHLHADHCLDLPGHVLALPPSRPSGEHCTAPATPGRDWGGVRTVGRLTTVPDIFDLHHWAGSEPVTLGARTIVPRLVALDCRSIWPADHRSERCVTGL